MPEGDTLYALAEGMRPDLVGRALQEVWVRDRGAIGALAGRTVEGVEARGKHLLITLEGDVVLRTHLGLKGIWHRYRGDEPWRRARGLATVVLRTEHQTFVCFRARQVALEPSTRRGVVGPLADLGPDLTADPPPDLDRVVRRARTPALALREIADVLLDQTVAAGIGNVFKSEVLFIRGVHPWTKTGDLRDDVLRGLFEEATAQLRRNRGAGPRTTTPEALLRRHPGAPKLHVYGRPRRPCLRCATPVLAKRQGPQARTTYWCPRCQPAR